jgi:hypothetical protein
MSQASETSGTPGAKAPVPFIDVFNDLNHLDGEMMQYPNLKPGGGQPAPDGPPEGCTGCGCEQH